MRTFLRKIRRSLIESGSTRKYLLYSIGEIALVVIGILIALQINNWNEKRIKREEEIQLLSEIKEGLQDDSQDIQENKDLFLISVQSIDVILKAMEQGISYHDTLATYFSQTMLFPQFIKKEGPYDALKSKGMDFISNTVLRKSIVNIYDASFERIVTYQNGYELDRAEFYSFHLDYFDLIEHGRLENGLRKFGSMVPHDFSILKRNEKYRTMLKSKKSHHQLFIYLALDPTLTEVEQVINAINQEIEVR